MSWACFWAYCKYRFRARNAHGLHSPFVYRFYTEVLQAPQGATKKGFSKAEVVIARALPWLQAQDFKVLTIEADAALDAKDLEFLVSPYTCVILKRLYRHPQGLDFFKNDPSFTVTLDSFWVGFALRRTQAKEHFVLQTRI